MLSSLALIYPKPDVHTLTLIRRVILDSPLSRSPRWLTYDKIADVPAGEPTTGTDSGDQVDLILAAVDLDTL